MLPRSFVLRGLWALAQVGLEKLVLRSHFLCHQDNSHVQLLSIHLFQKVMELVVKKGKKLLKTIVSQSLFPLLIRLHDENQCVAEVRTQGLLVSLWEGAQLPPALAARGLQPSLWPWHKDVGALCPGATSGSLLLCRLLSKHCFVQPGT